MEVDVKIKKKLIFLILSGILLLAPSCSGKKGGGDVQHDSLVTGGSESLKIGIEEQNIKEKNKISDITYEIQDGNATITGCNTKLPVLEIPAEIDGFPVKSIGWGAFSNSNWLENLILPEGLIHIEYEAFYNCRQLSVISFPKSIEYIDLTALEGTAWLANYKGDFVTIQTFLYAYKGTDSHISIPEGIESMSYPPFLENHSGPAIKSLHLPSTFLQENSEPLIYFPSIETITVSEDNPYLCSIDGILYDKEGKKLIFYPHNQKKKTIVIRDGVEEIAPYSFQGITCQEIITPPSLKKISTSAFIESPNLISVSLNEGLEEIDTYAFSGCTMLNNINIPDSVKEIESEAFDRDCPWYQSLPPLTIVGDGILIKYANATGKIVIPKDVKIIYDNTFKDSALSAVVLPEGLKIIGFSAFANCTNLKEIKFPDSLTKIDYLAFDSCNIQSLYIPKNVKTINFNAFQNCPLTKLTIQHELENGTGAFLGMPKLKELTFSDEITRVDNLMFSQCTALEKIHFGKNIKKISMGAFSGCTNLQEITLPPSLEIIEASAFGSCGNLNKVIIENPDALKNVSTLAFMNCGPELELNIPENVLTEE